MELIHCVDYRRSRVLSIVRGRGFLMNYFKSLHSYQTTRDLLTWIYFGCELLTREGSTSRSDNEDHKQCKVRSLPESAPQHRIQAHTGQRSCCIYFYLHCNARKWKLQTTDSHQLHDLRASRWKSHQHRVLIYDSAEINVFLCVVQYLYFRWLERILVFAKLGCLFLN